MDRRLKDAGLTVRIEMRESPLTSTVFFEPLPKKALSQGKGGKPD